MIASPVGMLGGRGACLSLSLPFRDIPSEHDPLAHNKGKPAAALPNGLGKPPAAVIVAGCSLMCGCGVGFAPVPLLAPPVADSQPAQRAGMGRAVFGGASGSRGARGSHPFKLTRAGLPHSGLAPALAGTIGGTVIVSKGKPIVNKYFFWLFSMFLLRISWVFG